MIAKLLVLVVLTVAAPTAFAAPRNPEPRIQIGINEFLNKKLANIPDPITPKNPVEIKAYEEGVADIYIQMPEVTIVGAKDFTSVRSTVEFNDTETMNFFVDITSPKVTLKTDNYFIDGSLVDHIQLVGGGPAMISVDEMNIKLTGRCSQQFRNHSIVFQEAVIDLEMWRWTVDFEDLMPGTDLGTVFNEFFTMCGPEIFDTLENKINNSGNLPDILNKLFQTSSNAGSDMWDADSLLDILFSSYILSNNES